MLLKQQKQLFVWILLLGCVLNFIPNVVQAVEPITGINVLFIIDQSGSMGGTRFGGSAIYGEGNDAVDLRFAASQYAIDWLSEFHGNYVGAVKPDINISVVYFGTNPQQWVGWTAIDTEDPDWSNDATSLISELAESAFPRNLVDTNFNRAFASVGETLFPTLPVAGGNPYNAVVVITDGGPCTGEDARYHFTDPNDAVRTLYTCDLRQTTPNVANAMQIRLVELEIALDQYFPPDVFEYYVIGLDVNATSDPTQSFWNIVESGWRGIACDGLSPDACDQRVQQITTSSQMGSQLSLMLGNIVEAFSNEALDSFAINLDEAFTVPPFQQQMRIDIFKSDDTTTLSDNNLNLLRPDGAVEPITIIGDVPLIQSVVVSNPMSGNWVLNVNGVDTSIISQIIATMYSAGVVAETTDNADLFITQPLQVRLVDGEGNDLGNQMGLPVMLEARVYDSRPVDRDTRPQVGEPIVFMQEGNSATFTGNWFPSAEGDHEIRVSATYVDPTTNQLVTFINDQTVLNDVTVESADIVWEQVFEPSTVREDRAHTIRAMVVSANSRTPLANTDVLVMRITYTDTLNPGVVYQEILLNELPNDGSGLFEVNYVLGQPGTYIAVAEIGVLDANEQLTESTILEATPPREVVVQAITSLSVIVTQPRAETQILPALSLNPFRFQWRVPVTVQVQIRAEDGSLVSLASATGNAETRPTVTITSGNQVQDVTDELVETQSGVYSTQLMNLGYGTFDVTAQVETPSDALVGTYQWASPSATGTLQRGFSWLFGGLVLAILAILLILFLILIVYRNRLKAMSVAPLHGNLELVIEPIHDPNKAVPIYNIEFDGKRNTYTNRNLPPPLETITVTTKGAGHEEAAEKGILYITEMTFRDAEPITREIRVRPDEDGFRKKVARSEDGEFDYTVLRNAQLDGFGADPLDILRK